MPSEMPQPASSYAVTVDRSRHLPQLVTAGHYDWVTSDITPEHFRVTGQGTEEVRIELVHFNRGISTDRALSELDGMGYHPADIAALLVFGETYSDIQRTFPVVALGSVWHVSNLERGYPYLCGDDAERGLGLRWCQDDWGEDCRFAVLRK